MGTVIIDGKEMAYHEAHQDLWNELSQNPGMTKEDYFRKHEVQISKDRDWVRNNCFACESCNGRCKSCPIVRWRDCAIRYNAIYPCNCYADGYRNNHNELFEEWFHLMRISSYDEACKIAKQIADLEWIEPDEP